MPVVTALPAKAVKMIWWSVCVLALWVPGGVTFSMYKEEIPNGDHVPHPCKANFIWHGVGHQNALGGGAKNPFGEDFSAHGKKWNADLCNKDSDGDGRTNGQELGDPDCVWTKGELPRQTEGITHPGVCEPMDSAECMRRNAWVDCSNEVEFVCPHINDPDVRNVTISFPRTKVPAKETTYICFNFELPDDREYHLIANKPYIDNQNVMHHIILNGCDNNVGLMDSPQECLMGTPGCTAPLAGWTVGQAGVCWNVDAGYPFGNGRSRIVSMQLHWTNPGLVDEWFDSSGLTLYYTPKLRTYNAGLMNLGQTYLSIPPGQTSWVHQGTCTGDCTRRYMTGDIQVFAAQSHMHYLGSRQNITLSPSGRPTKVLVDDNPFRYDSPMLHEFDPPLTVQPGDQLQTFCTFQSRSRTQTTTYGEGSFEEMCFAFLWYYPAENIEGGNCVQWKDMDFCSLGDKCDYLIFQLFSSLN